MEVLIHVPGDREAVIKYLDEKRIDYKIPKTTLYIKDSCIELESYGAPGNRLSFDSNFAKNNEGKVIQAPYNPYKGETYLPFKKQEQIFKELKNTIIRHRKEYYKDIESRMEQEKKKRENKLKKIEAVDFEKNLLKEEHKLEDKIDETIRFIANLQRDFPKATFSEKAGGTIDVGALARHIKILKEILSYLRDEEIESVHILKDVESPILIEKEKKKMKIQKKHIKKLSSKLNSFVKEIKYTLRVQIKDFQITIPMRKHLKEFYEKLFKIYSWYAELFKKEAK